MHECLPHPLLLLQIGSAVEPALTEDDFFSLGAVALLEPVLMLLGYGRYAVSSSSTIGCAAVLIHTQVPVAVELFCA